MPEKSAELPPHNHLREVCDLQREMAWALKNNEPKLIRRRVKLVKRNTLCLTHDRSLLAFIPLRLKQLTGKLGKAKADY